LIAGIGLYRIVSRSHDSVLTECAVIVAIRVPVQNSKIRDVFGEV